VLNIYLSLNFNVNLTPNSFGVKLNDLTENVNMIKVSDEHQELLEAKNNWCSPLTSNTDSMAGAGNFDV